MQRLARIVLAGCSLVLLVLLAGCAEMYQNAESAPYLDASFDRKSTYAPQARMLIWRASTQIEAPDVPKAAGECLAAAEKAGGYAERSSVSDAGADLMLRVPAESLGAVMKSLHAAGKVLEEQSFSEDVTDEYVDVRSRHQTQEALLERLTQHLDKAQSVEDILAIEREIARIQSDLDAMAARMKSLEGRANLASLEVVIRRKQILGPVGYAFKGVFWAISKLFIIQE